MPNSRDPLGKRALFWAPAERTEDGPRRPEPEEVLGRHALFSSVDVDPRAGAQRSRRVPDEEVPAVAQAGERRAGNRVRATSATGTGLPGPAKLLSSLVGPIHLDCSFCGASTKVDVFEFALLHLPAWLWRPGKGYTRLMNCPACRKRTWISASLLSRLG